MKIYLFKVYERLWHWVQSGLVTGLLLTGLSLHGTLEWPEFAAALRWHETMGVLLLVLTAFTMFWHATTGEGKQFWPTGRGFADQIRFYTVGIFRREPHPSVPTPEAKFNPLQRMAYFSLLVFIFPVQMATGFLLWALPRWPSLAWARPFSSALAFLHTAGAFGVMAFLVVHLYMITTGRTLTANLRAMLTGWAEEDPETHAGK
jgi:thiosulfate reductase cytochrome b subunit